MTTSSWAIALSGLLCGVAIMAALPADQLFITRSSSAPLVSSGERWACPMMDFIGNHPGPCPVCGMALVKVTAGELSSEQQQRMGLETTVVEFGPATMSIRAYGAVRYDPRSVRSLVPRVSGRIVRRYAATSHIGVEVAAGDPLVDLYSPEAFSAQSDLVSAIALGNHAIVDALTQRFARWNLSAVATRIAAGGEAQDTVTIISPFAGRVIASDEGHEQSAVQIGSPINADMPLLMLADPDEYIVAIHIPETRSAFLRVGQPVRIASDDAGDMPDIQAAIAWLSPGLNPEIRAREAHIHLHDDQHRVLPGSLISARFEVALANDHSAADAADRATWGTFALIPKSAVLSTGVRHVAWKVSETKPDGSLRFTIAPLALGPRIEDEHGNDRYIVRAGLSPGDRVATQGAFLIDSQAQLAGTPSLLFPDGVGQ